ncbi:hypothetical protein STANM309S_02556 [Streptomyces tanashiensis]
MPPQPGETYAGGRPRRLVPHSGLDGGLQERQRLGIRHVSMLTHIEPKGQGGEALESFNSMNVYVDARRYRCHPEGAGDRRTSICKGNRHERHRHRAAARRGHRGRYRRSGRRRPPRGPWRGAGGPGGGRAGGCGGARVVARAALLHLGRGHRPGGREAPRPHRLGEAGRGHVPDGWRLGRRLPPAARRRPRRARPARCPGHRSLPRGPRPDRRRRPRDPALHRPCRVRRRARGEDPRPRRHRRLRYVVGPEPGRRGRTPRPR